MFTVPYEYNECIFPIVLLQTLLKTKHFVILISKRLYNQEVKGAPLYNQVCNLILSKYIGVDTHL